MLVGLVGYEWGYWLVLWLLYEVINVIVMLYIDDCLLVCVLCSVGLCLV